jgi:molybdopterin/thiamine biosynthesis adenylyltransferase/nitroreductase
VREPVALFRYDDAFSRTLGWVTSGERERLRGRRVAIAGLGGAGGSHLLTLTRLGIGAFHLADFDSFELANFNRQAGARVTTLGRPKVDVLARMARDVNPTLDLTLFPEGIHAGNMGAFLEGVDVYVDALDFFAVQARRAVFAACHARGIPAITVAPLGMSAALLTFLPGRMTFEEYFRLDGCSEEEQLLRFLVGLAPARLHSEYLVDPSAVDLARHRGPSTPMACELAAAVAGTEVLKLLLGRGRVLAAPRGLQVDLYAQRAVSTFRPWGNRNPLQRLSLRVARRRLRGPETGRRPETEASAPTTDLERVLDLARWAPSGDNTQPWTFETDDSDRVVVRGRETGLDGVYDLDGRARWIALGALLETLAIAATTVGRRADVRRLPEEGLLPAFQVDLTPGTAVPADPLAEAIRSRTVQRRALSSRALTCAEREALEAAVAPQYAVRWLAGRDRLRAALVNFETAGLRLRLPEAYPVHRHVVEWSAATSVDRIPDKALGLDPMTLRVMRWAMKTWTRARRSAALGGTLLPRLEMDLWPGLACGAHFALVARSRPESVDDFVAAGRAVQRFWLTATRLRLQLQPAMAAVIFRRYAERGIVFSRDPRALAEAAAIGRRLDSLLEDGPGGRTVFFGRIGAGKPAQARSVRLPLRELALSAAPLRTF